MHDKSTASWNGIIYKERDVVIVWIWSLPLAHPLSMCLLVLVLHRRTFREMGAQLRSRLLWDLFEGCHSGPGSCCSFHAILLHHGVSSLCYMLLTLHGVFSKVMDQDPLKPWAKSNLSLVISIRNCDCSSIQITNTDVLLEKSFRDHLPPVRDFCLAAGHLLWRARILKGLGVFLLNFGIQPSTTWRITVHMTSIWVLGHCGRGSIFNMLDILEFSLRDAISLPTIGSGS